jgi:hypothetical protein
MDHFEDGRIVNKDQHCILFMTCNLTFITAVYAFYKGIYVIPADVKNGLNRLNHLPINNLQ